MKKIKIIILFLLGVFSTSCDLDEEPIILSQSLYENPETAKAALDGIYRALSSNNSQELRYFVINGFSGFFNTNKNGGNVNNINNANLFSLKPIFHSESTSTFSGIYATIAQANSAIAEIETVSSPLTSDELLLNDIKGQAYFTRAWCYFSLTRLYGDIPMWLVLPDSDNISKAKSTSKEVYAQAIEDAKTAVTLMNGQIGIGYPKPFAANMLLAKLHMTLATNSSLQDGFSEQEYWQMAYDEAIKVYGQYSLVADYSSLFTDTNENTTESIFELQISEGATNSQMGRQYSPWQWKSTQSFGRFRIHADVYDDHLATYPADPRIDGTFISTYTRPNGRTANFYPVPNNRTYFNGHPWFFKFAEKDQTSTNQYDNQNTVIYRYADLLLMLAEISNELQNGKQLGYVTEVLARASQVPHAGYTGSQADFRDAIMREYRYELLGEGEDAHNNRRRGFTYFVDHVITPHNTNPGFTNGIDLMLSTDENQVMILPFPQEEINFNDLID